MWPFPKTYFEWSEPEEYHREHVALERKQLRWWYFPLTGIVIGVILFFLFILRLFVDSFKTGTANQNALTLELLGEALLIFVAVGILISCVGYFGSRITGKLIIIGEDYILTMAGNSHRRIKLKDVSSFTLQETAKFRVLILAGRNGGQVVLGVPLKIDVAELEAFFSKRGLRAILSADDVPNT